MWVQDAGCEAYSSALFKPDQDRLVAQINWATLDCLEWLIRVRTVVRSSLARQHSPMKILLIGAARSIDSTVPAARAALTNAKSVEGKHTGQVFRVS
jgi:hypothetical protein